MSKIQINDRCPLQSECGRKKCENKFCERDCSYYQGNARPGAEIPDQVEAMEAEWEARMSAPSVLADTSAPSAPPKLGSTEETLPKLGQLMTQLPVDKLFPHPDNPRKDLGDLTELADSIKANGIFQNLTVVPVDDNYETFTVVIGHRRLAAAKLAGLREVPCVITEMDQKEQVQTMLLENMQRSDLTVYEQAQGFQMMLDLGSTVVEIAKKSGFSKATVRRRVKLLELDQQKFKASAERGAMLQDYVELEKIEDPELKNKVLDAIGTNNFHMTLKNAINEEKNNKYIAEVSAAVSEFATLVEKADYSIMQYAKSYETWTKGKVARPDDAGTAKYYYTVSNNSVSLYREKVETSKDVEAKEAEERRKVEFNRRETALKKLAEDTYQLRFDFIKSYSKAKKNLPLVLRFTCLVLSEKSDCADFEILAELLDIPVDVENDDFDMDAYDAAMSERPEYTLLATAYAAADYARLAYHRKTYRMENGKYNYHLDHEANEQLDFIYAHLTALGYEMSDEEKALQDGTHELFHRGDLDPKAEQEVTQDAEEVH